jgi:1,4-dihydroxy-2-naphthoate octaprenyltransferase
MPVFCFGVAVTQPTDWGRVLAVFCILHLLVYPASNGFNSYYDRDEGSIGGLKNPPKVKTDLLYASLFLDLIATVWGFLIHFWFGIGIFLYGLVSKAYSYDKIRLKKYPFTSWLIIGFFQGAFTLWLTYRGVTDCTCAGLGVWNEHVAGAALLSSWMLLGSYPMTQVYQHAEDSRRGDRTLSLLLGIRGTFVFTLLLFSSAGAGYFFYFWHYYSFTWAVIFESSLLPVVLYFLRWFYRVWVDTSQADFQSTMRLNLISAVCMNGFFVCLWLFK